MVCHHPFLVRFDGRRVWLSHVIVHIYTGRRQTKIPMARLNRAWYVAKLYQRRNDEVFNKLKFQISLNLQLHLETKRFSKHRSVLFILAGK